MTGIRPIIRKIKSKLHKLLTLLSFSVNYVRLKMKLFLLKKRSPDRKVIVINLVKHLGDIVACEPVSRYVREREPGAYIIWTVRKTYRELIDSNPNIDETVAVYCLTEWIYLARTKLFDEIVDLHIQNRACPTCNVPLQKNVATEVTLSNYFNFGNILSSFCHAAGLPDIKEQPKIYISDEVVMRVNALNLPDDFIVIHCTSNETARDWLEDRWYELAGNITKNLETAVVEVGSTRCLEKFEEGKYFDFCGKLSILETAEVIRRAELYVGIESGPAHLANAVGTYGIILLGHYRAFKRYMPYSGGYQDGTNATLVYADGPVADLPVERVYAAIAEKFRHREHV